MSKKKKRKFNEREAFLFYRSFYESGEMMTPEQRDIYYRSIFEFIFKDKPIPKTENPILEMAYTVVRPVLMANVRNYKNGCKGGAPVGNKNAKKPEAAANSPKQPKNNPQTTQKQRKENVNVTDKVTDKSSRTAAHKPADVSDEGSIDYSDHWGGGERG